MLAIVIICDKTHIHTHSHLHTCEREREKLVIHKVSVDNETTSGFYLLPFLFTLFAFSVFKMSIYYFCNLRKIF